MGDVLVKALWVYGLTIVVSLAVAVVIKLIVVVLNALERRPAVPAEPAPVVEPAHDVLADHVAAIAAAVYSTVGAHRIVRIEEHRHSEWVVEGRAAHHASHTVPHHPRRP
jgi:hypothetical protein